jgi:hypothetical protein
LIVHLAAFCWQDGVSAEEQAILLEGLRRIADDVAGVRAVYADANLAAPAERGLSHAVLLLADDREAHQAYQQHPAHVAAANRMDLSQEVSETHQPGIVVDFFV